MPSISLKKELSHGVCSPVEACRIFVWAIQFLAVEKNDYPYRCMSRTSYWVCMLLSVLVLIINTGTSIHTTMLLVCIVCAPRIYELNVTCWVRVDASTDALCFMFDLLGRAEGWVQQFVFSEHGRWWVFRLGGSMWRILEHGQRGRTRLCRCEAGFWRQRALEVAGTAKVPSNLS